MIFRKKQKTRPDTVVGLDLGTRQIKAVVMRRQGTMVELCKYVVRPQIQGGSAEQYGADLKEVMQSCGVKDGAVRVTLSCPSAMVCQTEFPRVPLAEVKSALQINSAHYLRRDFSSYYLDVFELEEPVTDPSAPKSPKIKVLVGGALRDEVNWYRSAMTLAKINPDAIELSAVSVVNAMQLTHRELCEKEAVLLLDIGANSTSLNFLRNGQPIMTRITQFGGEKISEHISQMLTMPLTDAEQEKLKMTDTIQPLVRHSIGPLVQEVRASIDFFERQHECHVAHAYACGGSACSPALLEFLGEEVGFRIECLNPVSTLDTAHFNGESPKLMALAPSLAGAIAAAATQL